MKLETTLRALADPTRLRIMRLLADMELAVGELAQVLGQSQPRVSRHIRILCDAGLAERRREGSWVFLRIAVGEDRAPPLGAAVAIELARLGKNVPFAYNRKEAKDHGEGGSLVGAPLKGRVLIVDDVMSAGTAARESIELIKAPRDRDCARPPGNGH